VEKFLEVLQREFGARPHPNEPGAYLVGQPPLPFHRPRIVKDHLSILSFNYWPLPISLIEALVNHPELVPESTKVLWAAEQDLIVEGTLRDLNVERDRWR